MSQHIAIRQQTAISNHSMKHTDNTRASPMDQSPAQLPRVLPLVYILLCSAVSTGLFIQRNVDGGNQKLR